MEDPRRAQIPLHQPTPRQAHPTVSTQHASSHIPLSGQFAARATHHSAPLPLHRRQRVHRSAQSEPQAGVSVALHQRERALLKGMREAQAGFNSQTGRRRLVRTGEAAQRGHRSYEAARICC